MRKYKNQTLISVIGLIVGFTCFALATLWIRYERTFDSFHKNAGQIYVVYLPSSNQVGYDRCSPRAFAAYLKEMFPEIANSALVAPIINISAITVEGVEYQARFIRTDTSFLKMFDVKIIEGKGNKF